VQNCSIATGSAFNDSAILPIAGYNLASPRQRPKPWFAKTYVDFHVGRHWLIIDDYG